MKQARQKLEIRAAYQDHDLVICNRFGRPANRERINRHMNIIIDEKHLSKITFHGLRHTHATMLLSIGVHPKVVSERLSHSKINTTLDTVSPSMKESLAKNLTW